MKIERFKSVWDALESDPADRERLKMRGQLMDALRAKIQSWKVTQREAAKRLDIKPLRLNDLLKGRFNKFSLNALFDLATKADLRVPLTSRCGSAVDSLWKELSILAEVQKLSARKMQSAGQRRTTKPRYRISGG